MTTNKSDGTFIVPGPSQEIAYGPVPSRRLGRSMGINNIPPKVCSYACAYCQAGATLKKQIDRQIFYDPQELLKSSAAKLEHLAKTGESVDYIAFVPNGEPTLDVNLGREIDLLQSLGEKIAVITNSSLLWREETREELGRADWISMKLDSVSDATWRRLNRPHPKLRLPLILEGMLEFCKYYRGELVTETMLVQGVNDDESSAINLADFLSRMRRVKAYLSVPTRPPADTRVKVPSEEALNRTYQVLCRALDRVELLTDYEGNSFTRTGDVQTDLLAVTAVHPMREEAVREFLAASNSDWAVVDDLVRRGLLVETTHAGRIFYVRGRSERGSEEGLDN